MEGMIRSQHELRRNRIHYFSYHCLHNLVDFRKKHLILSKKIEDFRDKRGNPNSREIEGIAETYGEHVRSYLIPFTMYLLNNTANFIQNGWLVNKFPDELNRMADAMDHVHATNLNTIATSELSSIIETINYRIQRINFCIEAIEEERKNVNLPDLEYGT